jgi:DNA-binding NtrC family response regulator
MLNRNGYKVLQAASPRQALEIVKTNRLIDLVVSDNELPEVHGTRLVSEITQLSPHTACLLMTGGVIKSEDAPDGVTILKKPFSTTDLIYAVQATLVRLRNSQSKSTGHSA